jgi:hypothetical protein
MLATFIAEITRTQISFKLKSRTLNQSKKAEHAQHIDLVYSTLYRSRLFIHSLGPVPSLRKNTSTSCLHNNLTKKNMYSVHNVYELHMTVTKG